MKRLQGTDRIIARLVGETVSNIREEMVAAGHKVHHYSYIVDGFDETIHFADGWRADVRVALDAGYVWASILRSGTLERRPASEGPTQYLLHFDGRREVHFSDSQHFRDMTDAESDAWDAKRKARRQQRVPAFKVPA